MVGREQNIKKVPLPVAYHLRQAVGALTLHTGRNYIFSAGQKKGQTGKRLANDSSPVSIGKHCKYGDFF